jgi:hypothetical protein
MKLYDKQKFEVDGVSWVFRKGQMPQGTLHALTENGNPIAMVKPKHWSRPIWEKGNAVLVTRHGAGNDWKEHSAGNIRDAVRGGTDHALGYRRDRQIAAMENALKIPSKGIKASNDKGQKPIKFRKLKDLMEWQQRQKAQGKDINPNTAFGKGKDQDMGM